MLSKAEASTRQSARCNGTGSHEEKVHRKVMGLGHELVDHVLGRCFLVRRGLGPTDYPIDNGAGGE